jgi:hypothetical protein
MNIYPLDLFKKKFFLSYLYRNITVLIYSPVQIMLSNAQNVGIKALEIYFPSRVRIPVHSPDTLC